MKIVLASASPRRKEILNMLNISFEVISSDVEEKIEKFNNIEQIVQDLATLKAKDVLKNIHEDVIVIGADTVVCIENDILGKPKNAENATNMLNKLSGKQCKIHTGMCVIAKIGCNEKVYTNISTCNVEFRKLTNEEIQKYIQTQEPLDKAGAFAIQGIGAKFIQNISGDFYAGVGLSIYETYSVLRKIQEDFSLDIV